MPEDSSQVMAEKKKKKKSSWLKPNFNERIWLMMLLPAIVLTIVFRYMPMFGIIMAFQDFDPLEGFMKSPFVGFENFKYIFIMPGFARAFFNTLVIAFWKVFLGILVPLILALLINEIARPLFSKFVKTAIFLPFFLSWVILGGVMIQILGLSGPINGILMKLGLEPIMFLLNNNWFRGIIVGTDIWKGMGYNMIIFLAAICSIDQGLYEAAKIDGANRLKQTWHITLTGMAPVIILVATLAIGGLLNAGFEQVLVLYNPVVYETGDIIDTFVYRVGIQKMLYSISAAIDLFRALINIILIGTSYFLAYKFSDYRIF